MRRKTKLFSAFLAVMLLITAVSAAAFADDGSATLTAVIPCTVTLQIGEHGAVTVNGTKYTGSVSFQAEAGTVLTYTISPDSGYEILKVTYDGVDVTASARSGTYRAAALKGNATLTVTFAKKSVPPTPPNSPKTGDDSRPVLWAALLILSALPLAAALVFRKRRRAGTN